jgi:hypothetical protein
MPLNDTFLKPEPDKFNKKLKEAVAKYDSENVNKIKQMTAIRRPTTNGTSPIEENANDDDHRQDKVIVERDGQFLYVDSDDYMARERQQQQQQQIKILGKQNNPTKHVYTISTNKSAKIDLNLVNNNKREIKSADLLKRGRDDNKKWISIFFGQS